MRQLNLLLTSAGRRVELLERFRHHARLLDIDLRVVAADREPELSAACALADHAVAVPAANDPSYAEYLIKLCESEAIGVLIPTIDPELPALAAAREELAERGVTVAVSGPATIAIAQDKAATARHFGEHGIATPRTAEGHEVLPAPGDWQWPLIVKPRTGSASNGVEIVERPEQLARALDRDPTIIVQELLRGAEYTVNVYVGRDRQGHCVVPHLRRETRGGEVSKGITVRHTALCDLGQAVAHCLPDAYGPLCFQAIDTPEGPRVFEINARFGGGYPLADEAGARFPRWLMQEHLGLAADIDDDWREGVWMLRYDHAVFGRSPAAGVAVPWL